MLHTRTFKVLLCLMLLLVLAIPAGIAAASVPAAGERVANAQSAFVKYGPSNGYLLASSSVTLVWGTSSGASSYQYCYDTVNNNSCDSSWNYNGTSSMASISGLNTNTTYYWQVRANGPNGTVEANGGVWWAFTVTPTPTPTMTPAPFAKSIPANGATGQGLTTLTAWNSSPNAVRYEQCYDTINNGACDGTWTSTGTTQYLYLNSLSYSTTYYWQVRAVDGSNNTTYANNGNWWSFTTLPAPTATPPDPAFFKYGPSNGATVSSGTVTFAWGTSAGVTQYQYCYDTINNNACDTSWISAGTNTTGSTGVLSVATYYWEVRAINGSGVITYADGGSWWSLNAISTPTPTPSPAPFGKSTPSNGASGVSTSPVLAWSANSGAVSYEYCLDTVNNGVCDTGWVPRGSSLYVFPSTLQHGVTYSWQVRAIDSLGGITYANNGTWWTFTTN